MVMSLCFKAYVIHFRRQTARNIPVVRFGEDVIATTQAYSAVADLLRRRHAKQLALFRGRLLLAASNKIRDDFRRRSKLVISAPAIQGERRAVMAKKVSIKSFE
jgi:hypothetical protein